MKRMIAGIVILILAISLPALASGNNISERSSNLPDIEGWQTIEENIVDFDTPSGNYGSWERKIIIEKASGNKIEIHLFTGQGPGPMYIPRGKIRTDDRPVGFGATYETIKIGGFRAIIESYPYIGLALAISLGPERTLCMESRNIPREQIIAKAEMLLKEF